MVAVVSWLGHEHREPEGKRWNVDGYAVNLLNRSIEDLYGVNLIVKF